MGYYPKKDKFCESSFFQTLMTEQVQQEQKQSKVQDKLIGEVFAGRYKVISVVGRGGMSTVYKAQHTYMDRVVALKLLHQHLVSDPLSVQRFQQEARAAASLSHPNTVTVYDFGITEDGTAYLVMDFMEGPSVGELLDKGGPIPEIEAIDMFRQVLRGLSHAHKKGVIHRDLKPRNLVLSIEEDGSVLVKIVDFGIAKMIPQDGQESQHLTQTGEVFGSPIYMSPEQCSGAPLDVRSDIYSFGCVMFEILTGQPPLVGNNAVETMSMHVNDPPPGFKQIVPGINVSSEMEEVVLKCLEKKAKKRFQTAQEVLQALPRPAGLPPMSDTGTVVMRLGDLVKNSGSQENQLSTSRKPRRSRRSRFRITSKSLAITFGALFAGTISLFTFFPGTEEDPGSPMKRLIWQLEMVCGEWLMQQRNYGMALNVLNIAADQSERLGSMMRKHNYPMMIKTRIKQADAYLALGKNDKQEEIGREIRELDKLNWQEQADELIKRLDEAEQYIARLKKEGEAPQAHLADRRLNWAGLIGRIVEISRRLDAVYLYRSEDVLLKRSQKVVEELYGNEFPRLADLLEQRCDCLLNQDRNDEIFDQQLYKRIMEIRKKADKEADRDYRQDPAYIRSVLQYGQWLRDRNIFSDGGQYLRDAISLMENCKNFPPEEKAEYYGSYADYLQQINRNAEAEDYHKKAKAARQACGLD